MQNSDKNSDLPAEKKKNFLLQNISESKVTLPNGDKLRISVRTRNWLAFAGLTKWAEVAMFTEKELLGFKNLGKKSTVEITHLFEVMEIRKGWNTFGNDEITRKVHQCLYGKVWDLACTEVRQLTSHAGWLRLVQTVPSEINVSDITLMQLKSQYLYGREVYDLHLEDYSSNPPDYITVDPTFWKNIIYPLRIVLRDFEAKLLEQFVNTLQF